MAGFQTLYEEYARSVYRFLLRLTGEANIAEELLQETFYQALQHIDRFEGRCSLYTWLCQIGKNAWYKELHHRQKHCNLALAEPSATLDPVDAAIEKEDLHRIRTAIHALPLPYRDVFIMHAIGDIKLKEIAQLYQKSESWARVTYYRAKQQIIQEVLK